MKKNRKNSNSMGQYRELLGRYLFPQKRTLIGLTLLLFASMGCSWMNPQIFVILSIRHSRTGSNAYRSIGRFPLYRVCRRPARCFPSLRRDFSENVVGKQRIRCVSISLHIVYHWTCLFTKVIPPVR